jgi:hypothetical protein
MRITAYDVLSYLASGMTHAEILSDFPYLTQQTYSPALPGSPMIFDRPKVIANERP